MLFTFKIYLDDKHISISDGNNKEIWQL